MDLIAKILEKKIKEEAQKAIDKYIESTVINSILPHADGNQENISIHGDLTVELSDIQIGYTQMLGKATPKTTVLENSVKSLILDTVVKAVRPSLLCASDTISVNPLDLSLATKIDGLGVKKTLMGAGAQIDSIVLHLSVKGDVTGKWQQQPEKQ